ncbi:MAG TPA: hypothetical protein VM388_10480 [Acidimicrobiales bacterium]|nr:hypothetical protein [Acidimicrobiales bacterium]
MTSSRAAEVAVAGLTDEESASSAVYVTAGVVGDGEDLFAGRERIAVDVPSHLVFVDLEPRANWGHPCLYLLVDPDDNVTRIEARFPPSRADLRLVSRGPGVEDWMLLTERAVSGPG